ncbi:MAG: DUF3611 family protein [Oscillatoria sp. PMC 1068.18]|nr:DUF3611 family protein [Oscillatoria sp. PMC 1076.18]MEC4990637.1 DUF3611 family protein [Oscillatoria sp. PMC 1068.18]
MRNQPQIKSSIPQAVQKVSVSMRRAGQIGLWIQIFLGIVSGLILGGAVVSQNVGANEKGGQEGFGIFLAICGLITLGVSVYFCLRYLNIGKLLMNADPALRPSKADTIEVLRLGLIVNLVGMFLTLLGAEATVGIILGKALSQPQGLTTYDPERFVRALDIFIVQANINTIAAHFAGIILSLLLINRVTR